MELSHRNLLANGVPVRNHTGLAATVSSTGAIDLNNEFFQDLGGNGQRCVSRSICLFKTSEHYQDPGPVGLDKRDQ